MSNGAQEKLEEELASLQKELETLKGANKTSEACKAIWEYVGGKEGSDPLVTHSGDNPFFSAPSSGSGCCIVM
jgi:hypothetical protein